MERFHALDATRAFALLLGVVFHAAWSFAPPTEPFVYSAPIADSSHHAVFGWFFFTSHSFRMQLFFLIAGFFARLLVVKRGALGFAKHRFLRIALPLLVGWAALYPLVMAAWIGGANSSGRNLVELPLPVLLYLQFGRGLAFIPAEHGGLFSLGHLWFLYYLLWFCALTLVTVAVLRRAPTTLANAADRVVAFVLRSPAALIPLTAALALALWPMEGWWGVDTPVRTLRPSMPVLALYGAFFLFGWILHRSPDSLSPLTKRWAWYLIPALAISIGLSKAYTELGRSGYIAGSFRAQYPNLSPEQIIDWPRFFALLRSPATSPNARPEFVAIWQALSEPVRQKLVALPADPSANVKAGVCDALNTLFLQRRVLPVTDPSKPASLPPGMAAQRPILEAAFGGAIITDPHARPFYSQVKLGYSVAYALITWLLVFGTLGLFHRCCQTDSGHWRYVSDSAYWIYLAHLPLVAALQVWMAPWPLSAFVKFPLLLGIAFTLLFLSYHYLVRSTVIGVFLNGQRHPFTALPFQTTSR